MSRTAIYKGIYFGLIAGLVAIVLWVVVRFRVAAPGLFLLALALLIPGRIVGFYWRDLVQGLRLLKAGKFAQSKVRSESCLAQLQARPWIRRLIWLSWSSYSRNPEVLALNNLGAAETRLGEFDSARGHLERAIELDDGCPMPYFNLGVLSAASGKAEEAEHWFADAARRGYRKRKPTPVPSSIIFPPETSLVTIPQLLPSGFVYGIEILNDDKTPMEFVVSVLGTHLGLKRADAIRTMLVIHREGGALLALPSQAEAGRVAEAISVDAAKHNHPLICRAVSASAKRPGGLLQ